ncbi:MAG: phytanoyl-CoA dioxygenase family protein [SAR202 cluster bacterium]|nr:phytanoyl-CoA dioxygenase family protein [SAR202 cluster bacterium]
MNTKLPLIERSGLDDQIHALEQDGYVYFSNVLNSGEISELRDCMDRTPPIEENFDSYSTTDDLVYGSFQGGGFFLKHIKCAFNRDGIFFKHIDRSPIIDLVEAVHGDDCHIIGNTAWITGEGRPDQQLHADWIPVPLPDYVLTDQRFRVPMFATTAMFYLDDVYEELGPTKMVRGSHKSGRQPGNDTAWNGNKEQSILCKAGDVVLFRSEIWHRGSASTSSQNRYLLQVFYANRMVSQKFPPYPHGFTLNESILADATPRQRRLVGDHARGVYD